MKDLVIEGGIPLMGNVALSGAKNSAVKLLYGSLFSNEDIVLENFPQIDFLEPDIEIIRSLGANVEWIGTNRLLVNASGLANFEIPYDLGSDNRTSMLAAPALLFRFGRAVIPKIHKNKASKTTPVNRIISTWESFGFDISEDDKYYQLKTGEMTGDTVSFSKPTHMGTDSAILCAAFMQKEITINNCSQESEIDDLVDFFNKIGASVDRVDHKTLKINGTNIFKGTTFKIQSDKTEAISFGAAAALTKGNIVLEDIEKTYLTAFTSFLNKLGVKFEFDKNDMRVWSNLDVFEPGDITVAPSPGFVTDWSSVAALMLNYAKGESMIHETVYADRFDYIKDLNRMGADIELLKPSEVGLSAQISDDSYDLEKYGEPRSVLRIRGPKRLKGTKLDLSSYKWGSVYVLAALVAEGKSSVSGWKNLERGFENFFEKLHDLGAKISTD